MKVENIKVGDIVKLKSGGPHMTVSRVTEDDAMCDWFVHDVASQLSSASFNILQLRLIEQ